MKVYSNADSVELMVNGTSVGSMTAADCEQRTCVFEDVALSPGVNTLTATGAGVGDTVEWSLNTTDVNIAAGRITTGLVTSNGTRFGSDDFFVGGEMGPGPRFASAGGPPDIRGTDDPLLYKYYRVGTFDYDIPLPDGAYEVTLGFLEPNLAEVAGDELLDIVGGDSDDGDRVGEGDRVFSVIANGELVLDQYDVLAEAGASRVVVTETFPINVVGGRLVLNFVPVVGQAIVSSIKIVRQQ